MAQPNVEFGARAPDAQGMRLWSDLHQTHNGRLGVVINESPKIEHLEHWLRVNGIKTAIYEVLDSDDPQIKAEKIQRLMLSVGAQDFYVDIDPRTIAVTVSMGIAALLIAVPYVIRPEWRLEREVQPWSELVEELDSQMALRASRAWNAE